MGELPPILVAARRRRAVADRSARVSAAGPGRVSLVVVLPTPDADAILQRCDEAARLAR